MNEYRIGFEAISHLSIEDLSHEFYSRFDGILTERCGRISAFLYAYGPSSLEAALHVVPKLEEIGFSVVRTDQDLVDGPEIAARLNVSRQAVQNWAKGTRGSSFPHPVGFPGGKRVWTWSQIVEWARQEGRTDEAPGLDQDSAAAIDTMLANRRKKVGQSSARMDWMLAPGSAKIHAGMAGVEDYEKKQLRSMT